MTVEELFTFATYGDELKYELGYELTGDAAVDAAEDSKLSRQMEAAAQAADIWLNNDTFDSLPAKIVEGLFEWVRLLRASTGESGGELGMSLVKTDALQVSYGGSRDNIERLITNSVKGFWQGWRTRPLLTS